MRLLSAIGLVAVLVLGLAGFAFAETTGKVLKYDAYGFSVTLPAGSERIALEDLGGGGMQEAYQSGGLAYVIIATANVQPRGMSATAAVNMMAQMMDYIKSKDPSIPIHSLSGTTSQGVAAKGFGLTGNQGASEKARAMSRMPLEIARMFGSDAAVALLLVPVVEQPAMMGGILVVGPAARASECDSQVAQVVSTIVLSKPTRDAGLSVRKGSKTPAAPAGPEVKSINELKKGQIELVGVVKSTDSAGKCVDMLVGQAVPFGGHGAMLNPPRLKRVYVSEIAEGVKEGAVIIVVAKDTGPGKAVTADTLTVMDVSKMGF